MEGYLNKRNTKTGKFSVKQWNKRWFELAGDTLTYAKSPKDVTGGDITVFAVHECEDVRRVDETSFELRFPERRLLLQASSFESADQWIGVFESSLNAASGGRPMKSSGHIRLAGGMHYPREQFDVDTSTPRIERGQQVVDRQPPDNLDEGINPERPRSPRSLLANPAAFGKFHGDGRLFRQPGPSPALAEQVYPPPGRESIVATTTIETFEPAPPTPPTGSLRSKHSTQGRGSAPSQKQRQARLGVREVLQDDGDGITTIKLATPPVPASSQLLSPDEDWLKDDWDEDDESSHSHADPVDKAPPRQQMVPRPPAAIRASAEAFRPHSSSSSRSPPAGRSAAYEETALRGFLSPPETPMHSANRAERVGNKTSNTALQDMATPAVLADHDWLEEDWDSDDAE